MDIVPSLISAELLHLGDVISSLNMRVCSYHIDIMDFHFVPNLTWGPAFVAAIKRATDHALHVHCMVDQPEKWPSVLGLSSNDVFIFHHEATDEPRLVIRHAREAGSKVGVALNPDTPVAAISEYVQQLDMVLLMSVHPGFSGQEFIEYAVQKIQPLKDLLQQHDKACHIAFDGGINEQNIVTLARNGVDSCAIASALFYHDDYLMQLDMLEKLVENT